jgi:GNAT superfamily N-acetyltransferase
MEEIASPFVRLFGEAVAAGYRGAPGYEAHLWPDAAVVLTGEREAWCNVAAIGGGPRAEDRLREFVRRFRERNLSGVVNVAQEVIDRLSPVALELGLREEGRSPWMVYRPAPPAAVAPSGDFKIAVVRGAAELRETTAIMAAGFGMGREATERVWGLPLLEAPGIEVFLASRHGQPFSTGVTTTHGGEVVGIWNMATLPAQRRQGAARALLAHVIAYHVGRGARHFYLLATKAGEPLYRQVGFRTASESAVWLLTNCD